MSNQEKAIKWFRELSVGVLYALCAEHNHSFVIPGSTYWTKSVIEAFYDKVQPQRTYTEEEVKNVAKKACISVVDAVQDALAIVHAAEMTKLKLEHRKALKKAREEGIVSGIQRYMHHITTLKSQLEGKENLIEAKVKTAYDLGFSEGKKAKTDRQLVSDFKTLRVMYDAGGRDMRDKLINKIRSFKQPNHG
jgi:hypothetical protein